MAAWRRHDGSHSRQGPNGNRPNLGLCSRRSALWRTWACRRRCSTPRAIAPASIPNVISPIGAAYWKPTPTAGTITSINPIARRGASSKHFVGRTADATPGSSPGVADIAANARRGKNAPPISPIAVKAVKRIDAIFDIERDINGLSADERLRVRRGTSAPLVAALETWLHAERMKLSRHAGVAKAIDYMLTRWPALTRFLDDGRICISNNAAEPALRGLALGRNSWLFAGSQRGAERAAFMLTLIYTAKLNRVDPQAWLADVLRRIADTPQTSSATCSLGTGAPLPPCQRLPDRGPRRTVTIFETALTSPRPAATASAAANRRRPRSSNTGPKAS